MSQHVFRINSLEIVMGYDTILDYVFCTVFSPFAKTDKEYMPYSNFDDPHAGTHQQDVRYFKEKLAELGLKVPDSMYREVEVDQRERNGRREMEHFLDV